MSVFANRNQQDETLNKHSFTLSQGCETLKKNVFTLARTLVTTKKTVFVLAGTSATPPTTVGRLSELPLPCRRLSGDFRNFRYLAANRRETYGNFRYPAALRVVKFAVKGATCARSATDRKTIRLWNPTKTSVDTI